ncbi:MAG: efflux RND transporter periplasmic adaptor subunit [Acidobacteria bacterium]|nr:efflux RND transporter periplasmic adaptor subunit [Acidobacteriota bacterium]
MPAAPAESASAPKPESLEILSLLSVEREVDVLAQVDGVVEEILQDQGVRVEKGTELARLDDRDLQAKLARARADLEVAKNNVKFNEAELKARQAAYRRAQEMFKEGLNSQADLEEAEFKAKGAEYDLESWRSIVTRTEADIRVLELELEKTGIRAPFGGVVALRYIRPGQFVRKDDKCFRLSQLAPLQVRFLVPETAPRRPKPGELVNVAPVSDAQRVYIARIQSVSPTVDPASGSYDVTAVLTGADLGELRPGMSVRVLWGPATPPR